MNAIRLIIVLLRNTVLVTLVVALGFALGEAIGLPTWLQIICLIPAGYLFLRLSGDPIPPMKRWVPHAIAITVVVGAWSTAIFLVRAGFPSFLESSWWPFILILAVLFSPTRSIAAKIEHCWPFGDVENPTGVESP
ncbi:MAG: hypothetical protein GXX91_08220 [Verrucomicrobiaceae bacterium]|nr:hypothetical protein [Verrucomicrobiaceae bacterium]